MNPGWLSPVPQGWKTKLAADLAEDIGTGDLSAAVIPVDTQVSWYIETQAEGVLCGAGLASWLLRDPANVDAVNLHAQDGDDVQDTSLILNGTLQAQYLLSRERLALNYLMHLSGIATLTAQFVEAVKGTGCSIVDTRKTIPGLRSLQKYAVRCGGGRNHRMGLYDGIMIKDNHIQAMGSITAAVKKAKQVSTHMTKIEVECENLEMVEEAVKCGADIVMLDNMDCDSMREVVDRFKGQTVLEASGGVNLSTVREIAETGVDAISVGALTHSAPSLSIHLEVE